MHTQTPSRHPHAHPSHLWTPSQSSSTSHRPSHLFASPSTLLPHPPHSSSSFSSSSFWNSTPPPSRRSTKPTESLGPISASSSSRVPYIPPRALGYFAFPPSGAAGPVSSSASSQPHERLDAPEEEEASQASQQRKAEEESRAEKARLEREAEARRGEEAWVRSGGVLRDARGMRDVARTEAVRAELRLRDWEEGARGRWEAYERGWKGLLAANGGGGAGGRVRFVDIPWPVGEGEGEETRLEDLSVERVEEFLLEGLKVRGNKVTRKERVRGSLLRWHPDKMTGVLARVEEEDVEKVRAGIRVVTECLQSLNTRTS